MKKKIFILILVFAAFAVYFLLFYKNKTLKFIPKSADAVVLIDVKNFSRQYLFTFLANPKKWFESKKKNDEKISFYKSGVKIPNFVQIFHIKNSKFSNWYSVFEIKDAQKFNEFIKTQKFINKGNNTFQKNSIFITIKGEYCIFGTSNLAFDEIHDQLLQKTSSNILNANQFIGSTIGSFSLIKNEKINNFSIVLNDDHIEIQNVDKSSDFNAIISKIQKNNSFLEVELDEKNVKNTASFYKKSIADSSEIKYLKASANIQEVNDTIISYEYDNDFNEIEKIAVQKIIQPNYIIVFDSKNSENTWNFFQKNKWINTQNQFTAIPFQPNFISKNTKELTVKSTKNPVNLSSKTSENFLFIKNNPLLLKSFSTFSEKEKKKISEIDYLFYGNTSEDYYLKIQMKKLKFPLILN